MFLGFLLCTNFCSCTLPRDTPKPNDNNISVDVPYQGVYVDYCIFTGDLQNEKVEVNTLQIMTNPPMKKWVKTLNDKNCRSANKEDCMVWCLYNVPATYETITILKDTTQSKSFVIKKILTYI